MEREWFATTADLKRVFLQRKKRYLSLFLLVALSVFAWRFITPPKYTAKATFRFSAQGQDQSDMLRSFLQNPRSSLSKEGGAQIVLGSRALIREAAEDLGLLFEEKPPFFLVRWIFTAKDRLCAEIGIKTPDRRNLLFSDVQLASEEKWDFSIHPTQDGCFDLYDTDKKKIGSGKVGEKVRCLGHHFTVDKIIHPKTAYHIRAVPWFTAWKKLSSNLKIRANKIDKNIFFLTFSHPHREVAVRFLDRLMGCYLDCLRHENEQMAAVQMSYLEKRQEELLAKYDLSLQEHQNFLEQGLAKTGFLHLRQEVDLFEKPYEQHMHRLHEIDLKLERLRKHVPLQANGLYRSVAWEQTKGGQELEGVSPEISEKLCVEYSEQRDQLRVSMETFHRLQKEIFNPEFEVTSLCSILTDTVSHEMIEQAGKIALQLQDTVNHSEKDMNRLQGTLLTYKQFLSEHLKQQLQMQKVQSKLLQDKISSLQKTSARLLQEEKDLILQQLGQLRQGMRTLPEKWKRESKLNMQRELSTGMLEGLSQLTESKNVHHQLFYVESKPIDRAYAPVKPTRVFAVLEACIAGAFLAFFCLMKDFSKWLSQGVSITERSAKRLGIAFGGYLPKFLPPSWQEMGRKEQEVIRKIALHIRSHKKGEGLSVSIFASKGLSYNIAHLLCKQGLKVLIIECSPPVLRQDKEPGLYDYLSNKKVPKISSQEGVDIVAAGEYTSHFVELLSKDCFSMFIQEKKNSYDVVLLHLQTEISTAAAYPLQQCSDLVVAHADNILYDEVKEKGSFFAVLTC